MVWKLEPKIPKNSRAKLSEYDDLTAQLLFNRGLVEQDQINAFFHPDIANLTDGSNLNDLDRAAEIIVKTIVNKEKIVIYGDYDVDGVCASSILFDFLYRHLGANVVPYIPSRFEEGYGLNAKALKGIREQGADLLVTVDCGVRDGRLLHENMNMGLKFIVTDHHAPPDDTKDVQLLKESTQALIHPEFSENYRFKSICATTVAWYLVVGIGRLARKKGLLKTDFDPHRYLDLVALGTVCDVMPLIEENRILVKVGTDQMQETENPGLRELLINAGIFSDEITPYHLGYIIGPRLNAAGRLETALDAVRLLTSKNKKVTVELARKLSELNTQRQIITKSLLAKAEVQIEKWGTDKKLIFIQGENWPEGIVGLVAGRLCEKYHKPVIVASLSTGTAVGSARSIKSFHITDAISKSAELLTRFGGHAQAAGFTISAENIDKFASNLLDEAEKGIKEADLEKKLVLEAELTPEMLTHEMIESVNRFAPFGFGNKQPQFALRNVTVVDKRLVGAGSDHLKLMLRYGDNIIEAIGFNKSEFYTKIEPGNLIDIAGYLEENRFMNQTKLQIKISYIIKHV